MAVPLNRNRLTRRARVFITSKILLVLLCCGLSAQNQPRLEGEVFIGPTLATVGGGEEIDRYPGLGIGASLNLHLLSYGIGSLGFCFPPQVVFGERSDAPGLDVQRVHLPIGVMFSLGDDGGVGGFGSIGGGVTVGYGAMFGSFSNDAIDGRPFVSFDIALGIFERGSLKIRYSAVIGDYLYKDRNVGYHGLYVIGSTAW